MSDHGVTIQKPTSKWLTVAGFILTIGYIVFVAWYWSDQSSSLAELKPNEFGDFLAGVFAPLAFLWLVLGFLQQGMELRNSADALWLQGEELRNSVEQQRSLVEVTREQLSLERAVLETQRDEIERSSQPILEIRPYGVMNQGGNNVLFRFKLFNHGQSCSDARISCNKDEATHRLGIINSGDSKNVDLNLDVTTNEMLEFSVSYLDARSLRSETKIIVGKTGLNFSVVDDLV